jgi:glycosyltransferase involved in cell wall biosynthesis
MEQAPLVTIVTPTFNAVRYLEGTIRSVLTQDYPRLEYIVVDGGSTDGTLDILKRQVGRLTYVSGADDGAADAINRGFAMGQGEILAWLSADDIYLQGAVTAAVRALAVSPDVAAVYGEAYWIGAEGEVLGCYPTDEIAALGRECCICQPASFMRRSAMDTVGMLNTGLQCSFDYDLWIRLAKRHRFARIPDHLAGSRMHTATKTLGHRKAVFTESIALLEQHFEYVPVAWVYGYLSFLRDRRDQFFAPLQHSIPTYLRALPVGLRYNRAHPLRYAVEWMAAAQPTRLLRLWRPGATQIPTVPATVAPAAGQSTAPIPSSK